MSLEIVRPSTADSPNSQAARELILRVISPLSNGPYMASNAMPVSISPSSTPKLPPAIPKEAAVRRTASSVLRSPFPAQKVSQPRAAAANASRSGMDGAWSFGHTSNTPRPPPGDPVRRLGSS